jgi:hypothetical protein
MKKNLWELIQAQCEIAQKSAENKLGRPLTQEERHRIWHVGSPIEASEVAQAVGAAKTAAAVERYLAELPARAQVPEG